MQKLKKFGQLSLNYKILRGNKKKIPLPFGFSEPWRTVIIHLKNRPFLILEKT